MLNTIVNKVNLSGMAAIPSSVVERLHSRKVFFAHVPKCGGTSLSHYFRLRYALSHFKIDEPAMNSAYEHRLDHNAIMANKRNLVAYNAHLGRHFIQAHVAINQRFLDEHLPDFDYITMIRHPVERVISHYYFDERLTAMTPEQFLDSQRGAIETHVLCHFFGGLDWEEPDDVPAAAARARSVLSRFDAVGILEAPEPFYKDLQEKIGVRMSLPRRNVGEVRKGKTFPEELIARVWEMAKHDIEIYDEIKARQAGDAVAAA